MTLFWQIVSAYELGEGVRLGSSPVYIGGYLSMDYTKASAFEELSADDIALLSYGSFGTFSYLTEIEFKELYKLERTNNSEDDVFNSNLHIERIYIDYLQSEHLTLRLGKYNSPIGYWNILPVNVLRETTSTPQLNRSIYPKFTTGADIKYRHVAEEEIGIDLMLQANEPIDDSYNNINITHHAGIGIDYTKSAFSFKINGGYIALDDSIERLRNRYYFLLSSQYQGETFECVTEWGKQWSESGIEPHTAFYLQALYHITQQHHLVSRFEYAKDQEQAYDDRVFIAGYTYRPRYPIAVKIEYQWHRLTEDNKLLASLSVLF